MEQFLDVPVQPAIRAAVLGAAKAVERMGFAVEPYRPAGVERAPNVWSFFFTELAAPFTREMIAGKEDQTHPTGTEFYDKVKDKPDPTGTDVVRQLAERDAMRHQVLQDMPDIVVAPAAGVSAFPHGARRYDVGGGNSIGLFQATMPLVWVNLLGLPAMVVPWGRDESGMPVGVQLIAHPWFEERLLEFAVRLLP
jgi:Asp-tRNA(Asn)/Glu-tRNA(Gln) amidotransferase A subunit family amidase